ncbi:hypothetical protein ACFX10_038360 [Malus domestica]
MFSSLVNGWFRRPHLSRNLVQVLTKKKTKRPAEMLKNGVIPVVRLSFMTITLKRMLRTKLMKKALNVTCSRHDSTGWFSNNFSTDSNSSFAVSSSSSSTTTYLFFK